MNEQDAKEILDLVEKLNQEEENQIQNILELTKKQKKNIMKEFLKKELGLDKNLYAFTKDDLQKLYQKTSNVQRVANLLSNFFVKDVILQLRKDFLNKLFDKLKKGSDLWQSVRFLDTPTDLNIYGKKSNIGFKYPKICKIEDKEVFLSFEIRNNSRNSSFLLGACPDPKILQEVKRKFEKEGIEFINNNWWVYLPYSEYGEYSDLTTSFNNSKWNLLFIQKMDILVDHFFESIEKVRKAWDAICKEENAK